MIVGSVSHNRHFYFAVVICDNSSLISRWSRIATWARLSLWKGTIILLDKNSILSDWNRISSWSSPRHPELCGRQIRSLDISWSNRDHSCYYRQNWRVTRFTMDVDCLVPNLIALSSYNSSLSMCQSQGIFLLCEATSRIYLKLVRRDGWTTCIGLSLPIYD